MKFLWSLVAWPLICGVVWFFFSLQAAVIVLLIYFQVMIAMLLDITWDQKQKLAEMTEYLNKQDTESTRHGGLNIY